MSDNKSIDKMVKLLKKADESYYNSDEQILTDLKYDEIKDYLKQVDPKKLESYLTELNFIYPYHQVIGFYLEKAGYGTKVLKLFEKETPFKFYLTYNIRSKEFSPKWNLYYPKGI